MIRINCALRHAAAYCVAIFALGYVLPASAETPLILSHAKWNEAADFDVYFPLRNKAELDKLVEAQVDQSSDRYHKWLTPDEFETRFGPTSETIAQVTAELNGLGFHVAEHRGQMLHVTANVAAVESAFGVSINHARFAEGTEALVADGALRLTPTLAASGAQISQFTTVGPFRKHSQVVDLPLGKHPENYESELGPYVTADLRQAYDYPSVEAVNGKGVVIGILMQGGYNASDIDGYFHYEGVPSSLYPKLTNVPVNGGTAFSTSGSVETHLDIQQSAGMALGATERLYNLSDLSDPTVLYGLNLMVAENVVDVVNMSFGEPEVDYLAKNNGGISRTYLLAIEETLFEQGSAQGITFVASSGDHGSKPESAPKGDTVLNVEAPASDPYVTGVGGTNLVTDFTQGSLDSTYVSEFELPDDEKGGELWASGGGTSIFFSKPSFQTLVPTPSTKWRTVPDLALHMGGCPGDAIDSCAGKRSADWVAIGGKLEGVIGTSASSPDIVGMYALTAKLAKSRLGWMNPSLYQAAKYQAAHPSVVIYRHKLITGGNGTYNIKAPYDMVIGNGTIDARLFIEGLLGKSLPASGVPESATNP
jgi:kumamolisin